MELEGAVLDDVVARLRRVEGQIGGVVRMIEEGRDCRAVVGQMTAATKALERAGFKILAAGMRYCERDPAAAAADGFVAEELEKLFLQLA